MIAKKAVRLHGTLIEYIRQRINGANIYHQNETELATLTLDYLDRLIGNPPK